MGKYMTPPRDHHTGIEVGKTYRVWDNNLYRDQGNHDVGDNSQCFAEAVILACPDEYTQLQRGRWETTCTVRYLYDGHVQHGMFTDAILADQIAVGKK